MMISVLSNISDTLNREIKNVKFANVTNNNKEFRGWADPGFPVGGSANPPGRGRQPMILPKLHEIENILSHRVKTF